MVWPLPVNINAFEHYSVAFIFLLPTKPPFLFLVPASLLVLQAILKTGSLPFQNSVHSAEAPSYIQRMVPCGVFSSLGR